MTELWQPVVGYEGLYEVSDQGRVRSLPRFRAGRSYGGRLLKPCMDSRGYLLARLSRNGHTTTVTVHKLVAAAFLGPCPKGQVVRHGVNGVHDNSPANLSYGTQADNINDKRRDGTWQVADTAARRILTSDDVTTIYQSNRTSTELAAMFGVDQTTIRAIWRGKNWRSVTRHLPLREARRQHLGASQHASPASPYQLAPHSQ